MLTDDEEEAALFSVGEDDPVDIVIVRRYFR